MFKFIAIEGVIGVGKTTLARLLQPYFNNATVLLEVFEENPFLADFYADRERYAFQTQLFFLLSRYQQQKQAVPAALHTGDLISDYTFAKDELFAWLNLADDELAMYGRVHSALGEKIPKPDLIVYLRAEHETIMQRIALRDRPYERDMDPNYIRQLSDAYDAWLNNISDISVLTLDVTHLDFLANKPDLAYVAEKIHAALEANGISTKPAAAPPLPQSPQRSSLTNYQELHRHLDKAKKFDEDLFFNYILLTEELGKVAKEVISIWEATQEQVLNGRAPAEARREALKQRRATLRSELADLLAYTLKLANEAGIDLEEAYLDKMKQSIDRHWPSPA